MLRFLVVDISALSSELQMTIFLSYKYSKMFGKLQGSKIVCCV